MGTIAVVRLTSSFSCRWIRHSRRFSIVRTTSP